MIEIVSANLISIAINVSYGLLILAAVFAIVRTARGPSIADRVTALLHMWYCVCAFLILFALQTQRWTVLDIVLMVSLLVIVLPLALYQRRKSNLPSDTEVGDANSD